MLFHISKPGPLAAVMQRVVAEVVAAAAAPGSVERVEAASSAAAVGRMVALVPGTAWQNKNKLKLNINETNIESNLLITLCKFCVAYFLYLHHVHHTHHTASYLHPLYHACVRCYLTQYPAQNRPSRNAVTNAPSWRSCSSLLWNWKRSCSTCFQTWDAKHNELDALIDVNRAFANCNFSH